MCSRMLRPKIYIKVTNSLFTSLNVIKTTISHHDDRFSVDGARYLGEGKMVYVWSGKVKLYATLRWLQAEAAAIWPADAKR